MDRSIKIYADFTGIKFETLIKFNHNADAIYQHLRRENYKAYKYLLRQLNAPISQKIKAVLFVSGFFNYLPGKT